MRVAGVFVFVPIPGVTSVVSPARVILALGITIALFPQWPQRDGDPFGGPFVLWIAAGSRAGRRHRAGGGVSSREAFAVGAQVMGLQAGYAFASTIDPNTQADSSVLVVFSQIAAGSAVLRHWDWTGK